MARITENKIILITRQTRLDELIRRFNTEEQARFYIEHLGMDFSDYRLEAERYQLALRQTQETLSQMGRLQVVDRGFVPNFLFGPSDTVVVLGQDGLVANVLKYLNGQPVIGVNPDPARWEGVLLPFNSADLRLIMPEVFLGKRKTKTVTMAQATLNTGSILYGVNDLFIGPRTHTSARYRLEIGGQVENHSSSGIIVSTGLGSTGWFRSIVAGATGITSALRGEKNRKNEDRSFSWDAAYLYFSVREPWPSKTSAASITFGKITGQQPLILTSHMAENGVIFSDGIEADYLNFNSGSRVEITLADKQGILII